MLVSGRVGVGKVISRPFFSETCRVSRFSDFFCDDDLNQKNICTGVEIRLMKVRIWETKVKIVIFSWIYPPTQDASGIFKGL